MTEPKHNNEIRAFLIKEWKSFCGYVCETNPHYVDSDFCFNNFMEYLMLDESDLRREM